MGSAIAERIKSEYKVFVFDKDKNKTSGLSDIGVADNISDLLSKVDVVILAVKPQDFGVVLNGLKASLSGQLIISIVAGIPTTDIERILGKVRVVRAMPNLPAKIGKGMICISKGRYATGADTNFVKTLFSYLGNTMKLKEEKMDAATAISGSGPGFIYYFMESENINAQDIPDSFLNKYKESISKLAEELIHLDKDSALALANATIRGSIALLRETGLSPAELKRQVASKGGTTEAGLEVLHKGGSLEEVAKAALRRAKELSKSLSAGRQGG